ncbi:hypothetical protein JZ751_021295 [Albula glossodonta]|uniref:Uncharacterized protein n=1 Tax=Albula glossodonta TaxID=121402 RepID=A0A8T2N351_9TELE|nr:hypothetical protein JZ751_021295 [Albula glossodonta]
MFHFSLRGKGLDDSGLGSDLSSDAVCPLWPEFLREPTSSWCRLGWCNLTEGCCDDLASVLHCPHSELRDLELRDNELQDSGVRALAAGLEDPHCKLQRLGGKGLDDSSLGSDLSSDAVKHKCCSAHRFVPYGQSFLESRPLPGAGCQAVESQRAAVILWLQLCVQTPHT